MVDVYLDNGPTPGPVPSTIVDATALAEGTGPLRIVRLGMIAEEDLKAVAPEAFALPETPDGPPEAEELSVGEPADPGEPPAAAPPAETTTP